MDQILQKKPNIPQLPISGVQISNAVGKKVCKISKQMFCECKINQANIFASFIQVDNLNEKGIIGADVLNQYHIDFKNKKIDFLIDQQQITVPFHE